jgi:hypothetical protein
MRRSGAVAALPLVTLVLAACAPVTVPAEIGTAPTPAAAAAGGMQDTMVPAGYGTLRQDEVTVSIRSGAVLVKTTPLDERTIRLLAPDTYTRLHALRESRRAEAEQRSLRGVEMFLVSFFSYEPDHTFQPEDVQLLHQGRLLRPVSIIPLTPGWGRQRLAQQETQAALYAFEAPIEYDQPLTVRYGLEDSDEWRQILVRLETERTKIMARVR